MSELFGVLVQAGNESIRLQFYPDFRTILGIVSLLVFVVMVIDILGTKR